MKSKVVGIKKIEIYSHTKPIRKAEMSERIV